MIAIDRIDVPNVQWAQLSPLLVLVGGALFILIIGTFWRSRAVASLYAWATVATGVGSLVAAAFVWDRVTGADARPELAVAGALVIDGYSVFFMVVVASAVILGALLADGYIRREGLDAPELYALMLLSASGGVLMAMANDLIVVFLGLEILSIALYVLSGYNRRRAESQEAAIKYFVLGAFSSAFFLYGIALVYGATGSTNLSLISDFVRNATTTPGLLVGAISLLVVGLGFKVAAVPFHMWTPDVYQGAPTPVTGFMAAAAKAAGFAALLRIFFSTFHTAPLAVDWRPIVWAIAVLTLVVGSVLAVVQTDVKRMLAYSSISHAGYVLVGLQAANGRGLAGSLFYLLAYTFMVLGSFGVVTVAARRGDGNHSLDSYRGLASTSPLLAFAFTVFLLAQAGIPFTSGFLAKFYVISAVVQSHSYALAIVAMLAAVIAAFVYLRIIVVMYMGADGEAVSRVPVPAGTAVALTLAFAFTVIVGFAPQLVFDFARDAASLPFFG
jgi:NADH-quinone oxidoreductase subunit N